MIFINKMMMMMMISTLIINIFIPFIFLFLVGFISGELPFKFSLLILLLLSSNFIFEMNHFN